MTDVAVLINIHDWLIAVQFVLINIHVTVSLVDSDGGHRDEHLRFFGPARLFRQT